FKKVPSSQKQLKLLLSGRDLSGADSADFQVSRFHLAFFVSRPPPNGNGQRTKTLFYLSERVI
ncbi:MAG: hypothetical protein Q8N57_02275, partial [bacterium]|nr:hypothetical protein [bacterium]